MLDGSFFFECACHCDEHVLRFTLDKEEKEIYTSIFLNQYRPWWGRLWLAIKYVFGYTSKYGHFDCTILRDVNINKLRMMLDELERKG